MISYSFQQQIQKTIIIIYSYYQNPPNFRQWSVKTWIFFNCNVNFLVFSLTTLHWQVNYSRSVFFREQMLINYNSQSIFIECLYVYYNKLNVFSMIKSSMIVIFYAIKSLKSYVILIYLTFKKKT